MQSNYELDKMNDEIQRLARPLSIAARIEPTLIRQIRLKFLPHSDASLEADFWFSSIIQARTTKFVVMNSKEKARLRNELMKEQGELDQSYSLIKIAHETAPKLTKKEEQLTYDCLKMPNDDVAFAAVDEEILSILKAIIKGKDKNLARWALSSLPKLPNAAMLSSIQSLELVAKFILFKDQKLFSQGSDLVSPEVIDFLVEAYGTIPIGIAYSDSVFRISQPPQDGDSSLDIPNFSEKILNIEWGNADLKKKEVRWETENHIETFHDVSLPAIVKTITGDKFNVDSWQVKIPLFKKRTASYLAYIHSSEKSGPIGVGCFIAPHFILTGESILDKTTANEIDQIYVSFPILPENKIFKASLLFRRPETRGGLLVDVVVLTIDSNETMEAVTAQFEFLGSSVSSTKISTGYSSILNNLIWAKFKLIPNHTDENRFSDLDDITLALDGKPSVLLPAFQHSPLLDSETGNVLGIIKIAQQDVTLIPLYRLTRAFPELFREYLTVLILHDEQFDALAKQLEEAFLQAKKLIKIRRECYQFFGTRSHRIESYSQSVSHSNLLIFIVHKKNLLKTPKNNAELYRFINVEKEKGLDIVLIIIDDETPRKELVSDTLPSNHTVVGTLVKIEATLPLLVSKSIELLELQNSANILDPDYMNNLDYSHDPGIRVPSKGSIKYYLHLSATNLRHFVYDTSDLSTIRGGSLLLLSAVEDVRGITNLSTGASVGLYEFEADDAEDVCNEIRTSLSQNPYLRHATFALSFQPKGDDQSFAQDIAVLQAKNRWQQMQSPSLSLSSATAGKVCDIDLVRPATQAVPAPENKSYSVSESVKVRRLAGQRLKQKFYEEHIGRPLQRKFTHELDELTEDESKGNLDGKMAVIYLDGNRFGSIKKSVSNRREEWLRFDHTVKSYRREMLEGLLDRMEIDGDWQTKDGKYRIETLLWGGDELMWIVPAWKGWETLHYFYNKSENWKFRDDDLHHSGGIVFCHHNAPIHRITKLARDIAELAKEKDRKQNLFAYEVLESFDHVGRKLEDYRIERSPQPVDPARKNEVDATALILDGAAMSDLKYFITSANEKLPRKQLHEITNELLWQPPEGKLIDLAKRARDRVVMLRRIDGFVDKIGISKDDLDLDLLKASCGGDEAFWLHVNALWDYLA